MYCTPMARNEEGLIIFFESMKQYKNTVMRLMYEVFVLQYLARLTVVLKPFLINGTLNSSLTVMVIKNLSFFTEPFIVLTTHHL